MIEQRADGVLRRAEVYDYFSAQPGFDAQEAEQATAKFMEKYSEDGEQIHRDVLF